MAEPDNVILLTANQPGASEPIKVEVVAGEFKLVSGMTARAGSSFSVQESWMELAPGLCIDIGAGGLELFGEQYSAGTRLLVDTGGHLQPFGESAPSASAEASTPAIASPEFCAAYAELLATVVPEFDSVAEEAAWHEDQALVYEALVQLAPSEIRTEVAAMDAFHDGFVALLSEANWDISAMLDDPEASAAFDLLVADGNEAFDTVDAFVAQHCNGAEADEVVAAPDSDLPTYSEVVAEQWPGEPLCETQAGISGGPDVFMFGPFGDEESIMSMRQGYSMDFCPGSRYLVTGPLTVADGAEYPIGTMLTLDAELNFVAVSSWD